MRRTAILLCLFAGLMVLPAFAQSPLSDTYVLPVASHTAGGNGVWMSDISITNVSSATALTVQLVFVESGENNLNNVFPVTTASVNGSVTVPPLGTTTLVDALNGYRGVSNISGAVILGGDMPFAVTSRSYVTNGSGTIGQTVTPAQNFITNSIGRVDLPNAVAFVPGIANNGQYRTNLGIVVGNTDAAGATMGVLITVRDASGATRGTRLVSIPAGSVIHTQIAVSSIADRNFDSGSAEFRIVSGNGAVVPYASVVDNGTADAVFILGQFPANTAFSSTGATLSIFRTILNRTMASGSTY